MTPFALRQMDFRVAISTRYDGGVGAAVKVEERNRLDGFNGGGEGQ